MSRHHRRYITFGLWLIAVAALTACAATPAPKVPCDTELRPINPPQHPLP
jgi:hypothetical protein